MLTTTASCDFTILRMRIEFTKRSVRDFLKNLPLRFLVIAGLFLVGIYLFGILTHEVIFEKEEEFDTKLIHFFAPYSADNFIQVMKIFTFFGSSKFLLPTYVLIVTYFLLKRQPVISLSIAIIAITGTALSHGAKLLFQRARPNLPMVEPLKTYSFPSGHALSSFIFCSILIYLISRSNMHVALKWVLSALLLLFALTIGMSRIVLKMHYPTDVLAGFCLGFIWVILSFLVFNRIELRRNARQNSKT